jgi:hypothetical protein
MMPTVRTCLICGGRFCRLDTDWRHGPFSRRICSDCGDALAAGRRPNSEISEITHPHAAHEVATPRACGERV